MLITQLSQAQVSSGARSSGRFAYRFKVMYALLMIYEIMFHLETLKLVTCNLRSWALAKLK